MTEPIRIEVFSITGMPEVQPGDRVGDLIAQASVARETPVQSKDIVVVSQKVVSKAEGRLISLNSVTPSRYAKTIASKSHRDPRLVELILRESRCIVRIDYSRGILITESVHGFVCANAGIDTSNVPGKDSVSLLPENPDRSANEIRDQITHIIPGITVSVIISDTFGRAWREGHANFAIGVSGINPILDYRGTYDSFGKILNVTKIAVADELASAAELVTAKAACTPAAIIRGYPYSSSREGISPLIRERCKDLFR